MKEKTEAHRTAIARDALSRPCWEYVTRGLITEAQSVLDWGCGRGADVELLRLRGFDIAGYDPHEPFGFPLPTGRTFDVVMSNYVLNVIADPAERARLVSDAWSFVAPGGALLLAARSRKEVARESMGKGWRRRGDGWETASGTFQAGLSIPDLLGIVDRAALGALTLRSLRFKTIQASGVSVRRTS